MSLPYMQFFPADYFAKTRRLTCLEHGAYLQLLFMMWESNGVLRFDIEHLADEVGLTVDEFDQVWKKIGRYFQLKKGRIYNKRITDDLAEKKGISENRKRASKIRWSKKINENSNISDANALQIDPILQNPEPEPEDKKTSKKPDCDPVAFEPCWKAYPHVKTRMAKNKTLTEFRKLPPDEQNQLLAAITAYDASLRDRDREFVPAMERWLRDGKFRAFLPTDSPKSDRSILVNIYRDTGAWHPEWGEKPSREELAA